MQTGRTSTNHLQIRGGWVLSCSETKTAAVRLGDLREVELTGELHHALWNTPRAHRQWETLLPELSELASAVRTPETPPTLLEALKGNGFGQLFLELSGRCNERCLHCYAGSSPDVRAELDRATILGIVEQASQLGFRSIQFTGGDPLLSSNLLPAVRHARAARIPKIEVYTNGLALREELAAALIAQEVSFAFSLYSHDSTVHDEVTRTKGSWERTLRAIRLARNLGAAVRVGAVLRTENHAHVKELRDMVESLGVSRQKLRIDQERPVGRGRWNAQAQADLDQSDSIHEIDSGAKGRGKLAVTYEGFVVPCIFDRDVVLGRLDERTSLLDVLNRRILGLGEQTPPLPVVGQALACVSCQSRHGLLRRLHVAPTNDPT